MRALEVMLRIKGLSIERGVQRVVQEGVRLTRLRRVDARTATVCVAAQEEAETVRLLTELGYGVTRQREAGVQRAMRLAKRRALLVLGAGVFAALVFTAGMCVWQVDISGAGPAEGEIRQLLRERNVTPGRFKALIDTADIQREIERRLPQIQYVDVRIRGMRFDVACVQAKRGAAAEFGGDTAHLYAMKDGIITQMLVRSGTPKVRVGDAVFAGQLLVEGVERGTLGELVSVAANAQIRAQTFYEGQASVQSWTMKTTPTGRKTQRTMLYTPWGRWSKEAENPFELADIHTTLQPIGGGMFPIFRLTETAIELEGEKNPRARSELEYESAQIATQIAQRNIPIRAEVVDKWVDYSMIGEGFCAHVVIACEEEISGTENAAHAHHPQNEIQSY